MKKQTKKHEAEPARVRLVDAAGWREAEQEVTRRLARAGSDLVLEVLISGRLAYRVSNLPPKNSHKGA